LGTDSEVCTRKSDRLDVSNGWGHTRWDSRKGPESCTQPRRWRPWPLSSVPPGRYLGEHEGMNAAHVNSRNTLFHFRQARSPVAPSWSCRRLPAGHLPGTCQACSPIFFRDPRPLSGNRPYKKAKKRDTRKIGPGKGLTLTSGPLEQPVEAMVSRAGIRSYFGVEDRFLMIPFGHWLCRCVLPRCPFGSPGRLASGVPNGGSVDVASRAWSPAIGWVTLRLAMGAWPVLGSELQAERTRFGTVRIVSSPVRSMKASTKSIALAGLRSEEPNRASKARKLGLRSGLCFPSIPRERCEPCRFT